jgi:hypothetical protein
LEWHRRSHCINACVSSNDKVSLKKIIKNRINFPKKFPEISFKNLCFRPASGAMFSAFVVSRATLLAAQVHVRCRNDAVTASVCFAADEVADVEKFFEIFFACATKKICSDFKRFEKLCRKNLKS